MRMWLCFCGGVFVAVPWCFCGCVFVFLCWCGCVFVMFFCGGVWSRCVCVFVFLLVLLLRRSVGEECRREELEKSTVEKCWRRAL